MFDLLRHGGTCAVTPTAGVHHGTEATATSDGYGSKVRPGRFALPKCSPRLPTTANALPFTPDGCLRSRLSSGLSPPASASSIAAEHFQVDATVADVVQGTGGSGPGRRSCPGGTVVGWRRADGLGACCGAEDWPSQTATTATPSAVSGSAGCRRRPRRPGAQAARSSTNSRARSHVLVVLLAHRRRVAGSGRSACLGPEGSPDMGRAEPGASSSSSPGLRGDRPAADVREGAGLPEIHMPVAHSRFGQLHAGFGRPSAEPNWTPGGISISEPVSNGTGTAWAIRRVGRAPRC